MTPFYRINWAITAQQLRVVDQTGKQIGVLSREEALNKAKELEVDLVEIAPKATPPVAKLIDFKKFKYLEAKKHQAEKRKQKNVEIKEIRLSPFIGEHDFQVRVHQGKEFLEDGNSLKISIPFKGRLITRKQFGYEVIKKFFAELGPIKVVREPKFEGYILTAHVIRDKKN